MLFQRVSKTTEAVQNYKLHFIYVDIIDKMFIKWLPLNFVYQCLHQLKEQCHEDFAVIITLRL